MADEQSTGQTLRLSTVLVDAFDGVIRILGDAQRFGLTLHALHLEPLDDHQSRMDIALLVPAGSDADLLTTRFGRHGAVVSIEPTPSGDGAILGTAALAALSGIAAAAYPTTAR